MTAPINGSPNPTTPTDVQPPVDQGQETPPSSESSNPWGVQSNNDSHSGFDGWEGLFPEAPESTPEASTATEQTTEKTPKAKTEEKPKQSLLEELTAQLGNETPADEATEPRPVIVIETQLAEPEVDQSKTQKAKEAEVREELNQLLTKGFAEKPKPNRPEVQREAATERRSSEENISVRREQITTARKAVVSEDRKFKDATADRNQATSNQFSKLMQGGKNLARNMPGQKNQTRPAQAQTAQAQPAQEKFVQSGKTTLAKNPASPTGAKMADQTSQTKPGKVPDKTATQAKEKTAEPAPNTASAQTKPKTASNRPAEDRPKIPSQKEVQEAQALVAASGMVSQSGQIDEPEKNEPTDYQSLMTLAGKISAKEGELKNAGSNEIPKAVRTATESFIKGAKALYERNMSGLFGRLGEGHSGKSAGIIMLGNRAVFDEASSDEIAHKTLTATPFADDPETRAQFAANEATAHRIFKPSYATSFDSVGDMAVLGRFSGLNSLESKSYLAERLARYVQTREEMRA